MPIPNRTPEEEKSDFIARCMSDDIMMNEYPDVKQRLAICQIYSSQRMSSKSEAK